MGGTLGIVLYSEMGRASAFDEQVVDILKTVLIEQAGGDKDVHAGLLQVSVDEYGAMEESGGHAEERFIAGLKHIAKVNVEADKAKILSNSKQRDQKIYLTQEVWAKRDLLSRECVKFLSGLLTRNVNDRLGCGPNGFAKIKEHDFFESAMTLDWDKLEEGNATAPYIPKKEVNAKAEGKMKTFNTAGMKKLNKDDQEKWSEWDWTSTEYFQGEMAAYLYEQWGQTDAKKSKFGGGGGNSGGGGGSCCQIS